jgi:hypothetical protein
MSNNTTLNSELFTNLLAEAQFAAYENSIARQIVTPFTFPTNAGKVLQIPVYDSVSAVSLTEGTPPNPANTDTNSATITLGEIGTYFKVTDFLRDSAQRDVIADLGANAGRAIAEKMDADVFGLFNSLTNTVEYANGGSITVDNMFEAVAQLRARKIVGPLTAVLNPVDALRLKKELATVGGANLTASEIGSSVLRGFYIGSLAGCQIFESALATTGAVFAPTAMAHAIRGGIGMETQRQAAARATDIMMTAVVGQTIMQQAHAVKFVEAEAEGNGE